MGHSCSFTPTPSILNVVLALTSQDAWIDGRTGHHRGDAVGKRSYFSTEPFFSGAMFA